MGTGNAALFPFTFPGPESGEQHSREAPGREAGSCAQRRPGRPGQQEREQRGKKRPALRAERAAERGETSARPPVSGPPPGTQGGRPSAQHWHGRVGKHGANSTTCLSRRPGPPTAWGDSDPAGGAGFPRKRFLPAAEPTPRRAARPRRPDAPAALPANANAAPGRFRRRRRPLSEPPAAATTHPRPPRLRTAGSRLTPRRRPSAPASLAPRRAPASDQQRCRAQRRTRGHRRARAGGRARGRVVPPPGRRLLLRHRLLPSSGLCCNVCEADFERLARRPPAIALLPPPPSPPRPSPSPRRSTPFSSSAKFLNPFFPLPPIVTGQAEAAGVPAALGS